MEANNTGGQSSRRAVGPSDADYDDDDDDDCYILFNKRKLQRVRNMAKRGRLYKS